MKCCSENDISADQCCEQVIRDKDPVASGSPCDNNLLKPLLCHVHTHMHSQTYFWPIRVCWHWLISENYYSIWYHRNVNRANESCYTSIVVDVFHRKFAYLLRLLTPYPILVTRKKHNVYFIVGKQSSPFCLYFTFSHFFLLHEKSSSFLDNRLL